MDAVVALDRGGAEIGDDEPLGRELAPVVLVLVGHLGGDDIGARLKIGQDFAHRNRGGRDGVSLGLGKIDLAFPDQLAVGRGDILGGIAVEVALEQAGAYGGRNRAVADAVDHEVGGLGVHRGDRETGAEAGGEHIGIVGKADEGLTVGHELGDRHRVAQRLRRRGEGRPARSSIV